MDTGRLADVTFLKKTVWFRLPVLIYCALIFFQSSYPSIENLPSIPMMDKILHFFGYMLLGFLVIRALRQERLDLSPGGLALLALCLSGLYGISDEIHQAFVASRTADVMDALVDWAGSGAGVYLYGRIFRKSS